MPKYMAKIKCFVHGHLREPGEIFDSEVSLAQYSFAQLLDEDKSIAGQEAVTAPIAKEGKAKAKPSRASDKSVI